MIRLSGARATLSCAFAIEASCVAPASRSAFRAIVKEQNASLATVQSLHLSFRDESRRGERNCYRELIVRFIGANYNAAVTASSLNLRM